MQRRDKYNYYLDIAEAVLERSTCLRRNFGVVVVKNDEIIATGYNGAPRGVQSCLESKVCERDMLNVPKGQRYELCKSVHAEQNAIISASRSELLGADLFLVCHNAKTGVIDGSVEPCMLCKRFIINAGIDRVITRLDKDFYNITEVSSWLESNEMNRGIYGMQSVQISEFV